MMDEELPTCPCCGNEPERRTDVGIVTACAWYCPFYLQRFSENKWLEMTKLFDTTRRTANHLESKREEAFQIAAAIALNLWQELYSENTSWNLDTTLDGILMQISNMISIVPSLRKDRERLKEMIEKGNGKNMNDQVYKVEWSIVVDGDTVREKQGLLFKDRSRRDAEVNRIKSAACLLGLNDCVRVSVSDIPLSD